MASKKNQAYWQGRALQRMDEYHKDADEVIAKTLRAYDMAMNDLCLKVEKIIGNYAKSGGLTEEMARDYLDNLESKEHLDGLREMLANISDKDIRRIIIAKLDAPAYKARITRLEALKANITKNIVNIAQISDRELTAGLRNAAEGAYNKTMYDLHRRVGVGFSFATMPEKQVQEILKNKWSGDLQYSGRIWGNTIYLGQRLEHTLSKGFIAGASISEMSQEIEDHFGVSKYQATRLIRTETTYVTNSAELAAFKEAGVKEFIFCATLDTRTSKLCRDADTGKPISLEKARIGKNVPPLHPNCRSTILEVFEDEDISQLQRRGRNPETGENIVIPVHMKYKEWESIFVRKTRSYSNWIKKNVKAMAETGVKAVEMAKQKIKELCDAIKGKHETLITDNNHMDEFMNVLGRSEHKALNLYDKLASNFTKNEYENYRGGAHYAPWEKKIYMRLSNNMWERIVKTGESASFKTKFHEEFHQLDHILSKTSLAAEEGGTINNWNRSFTNPSTERGSKMAQAINKDVLDALNKSIEWYNEEYKNETGFKAGKRHKNLDRISGEARQALIKYLERNYPSDRDKALINHFTDAVGLATGGRLTPYDYGYWGHDKPYNKDRGIAGATSETWATFGAVYYSKIEEWENNFKELMPETWKVYNDVMNEVLEYALNNELKY